MASKQQANLVRVEKNGCESWISQDFLANKGATKRATTANLKTIKALTVLRLRLLISGAEGNRTPVQTYSSKAFYMLISLLVVGDKQEMNKPIHRLEDGLKPRLLHIGAAFCVCFKSAAELVTDQPAQAALMTT